MKTFGCSGVRVTPTSLQSLRLIRTSRDTGILCRSALHSSKRVGLGGARSHATKPFLLWQKVSNPFWSP